MLYGEVWQYSHGLPIFSIVGAPNLALLMLLLYFFVFLSLVLLRRIFCLRYCRPISFATLLQQSRYLQLPVYIPRVSCYNDIKL